MGGGGGGGGGGWGGGCSVGASSGGGPPGVWGGVSAALPRLYAYLTGLYGAKAAVMGKGLGRALAAVTDGLEDML